MVLNNELYNQLLRVEARKVGFKVKELYIIEYQRNLTLEQHKLYERIKKTAREKTLNLQDKFPTMLGINENQLNKDWIDNIVGVKHDKRIRSN